MTGPVSSAVAAAMSTAQRLSLANKLPLSLNSQEQSAAQDSLSLPVSLARLAQALTELLVGVVDLGQVIREEWHRWWHQPTLWQRAVSMRQLAVMLRAGVPLVRSLKVLESHSENQLLAQAWHNVRRDVMNGCRTATAMTRNHQVFRLIEIGLVRAGEESAILPKACSFLADLLEQEARLRKQVGATLRYPSLVFAACLLGMILLFEHVVPVFLGALATSSDSLPWLTQCLLLTANTLKHPGFLFTIALLLLAGGGMALRMLRTPQGLYHWQHTLLALPVLGKLFHMVLLSRFYRTLAALLESGLPIVFCLEVAGSALGNYPLVEAVEIIGEDLQDGYSPSEAFGFSGFFPSLLAKMLLVSEEVGQMPALLKHLAQIYEQELTLTLSRITTATEPVMIGFVGLFVALVLVGLFLPLYQVIGNA